jgi:hypothetical protein
MKPQYGNEKRCDGVTFLGITVETCPRLACYHVWVDAQEQYWYCALHYEYAHGRIDHDELEKRLRDDHVS